jgi:hypothetical protein
MVSIIHSEDSHSSAKGYPGPLWRRVGLRILAARAPLVACRARAHGVVVALAVVSIVVLVVLAVCFVAVVVVSRVAVLGGAIAPIARALLRIRLGVATATSIGGLAGLCDLASRQERKELAHGPASQPKVSQRCLTIVLC